ncbi:hypothetical protein AVEN_162078-1, partial [Araneus ventricosus]
LADALLQRASSLRSFHPSVTVGREERLIQGLIDLARAIRPVSGDTQEQQSPQKNDPSEAIPEREEPDDTSEAISEHEEPEESVSVSKKQASPFRIQKCSYYHGLRCRFSRKEGQQTKSLWIRMRKRLGGEEISSKLGLENISWKEDSEGGM